MTSSFDTTVLDGLPVTIEFFLGTPDRSVGEIDPPFTWTLCSPKTGKPLPWLEKRLPQSDIDAIEDRILRGPHD